MLLKKFCRFVIPSIISMWIFALYTMVDGIFVARGVGEYVIATVQLYDFYFPRPFATGTSTRWRYSREGEEEARNI
ncbi:MAG: hypothetical protein ACLUOI_36080 [Eisenbergiella sp.]